MGGEATWVADRDENVTRGESGHPVLWSNVTLSHTADTRAGDNVGGCYP